MAGVSQTTISRCVEFSGHLIDSLTLSKVIDRIQELGGDYHINDIRVGTHKKDVSSMNLTLYAQNQEKLDELLHVLNPYGAVPVEKENVDTITYSASGILPDDAFAIALPSRVRHNDEWYDLGTDRNDRMVIVIEPDKKRAYLEKARLVPAGACVVSSTKGIEW